MSRTSSLTSPTCHRRSVPPADGRRTSAESSSRRPRGLNGLVSRRDCSRRTAKVEYSLTDLGTTLLAPIEAFGEWASRHGDEVMAAQDEVTRLGVTRVLGGVTRVIGRRTSVLGGVTRVIGGRSGSPSP
ncbi:winged helix-turn-helix transcriptional regulator [Amycolatopsis sp. QT-25]|uniref:winged helix-turn-helix transcriptional regulator n=1 Tax=Amycolatopsis sp. QT-25 TaxID=3034022 RepID=UPI0023EBCE87|nr:winged helix-turn-helix transcriptional regulator [Amycolatopsis sp. QT-25]WET80444.1 winged helix-turn-helix transcriptional regulator [Amycolatopsis sp. QT-25]